MKDLDAIIEERQLELGVRQRELETLQAAKEIIEGAAHTAPAVDLVRGADFVVSPDEQAPITDKTCTGCKRVKPLGEFYRHPKCKAGFDSRCKVCRRQQRIDFKRAADATLEPVPPPPPEAKPTRADREAKRKAGEAWRAKPRKALLKERAELRGTGGMLRCTLPRAGEAIEAALAKRDICGALLFRRQIADHLEEVHGYSGYSHDGATREDLLGKFVAADPVNDSEAA